MTDYYEMPHRKADECPHAGVGKACRPCRDRFEESATRAEVAGALQREFGCFLAHDPQDRDRFWGGAADALLARFNITPKEDR